jgi:hypothetical protein
VFLVLARASFHAVISSIVSFSLNMRISSSYSCSIDTRSTRAEGIRDSRCNSHHQTGSIRRTDYACQLSKDWRQDRKQSPKAKALSKRAKDFAGIYTCNEEDRLDSIFDIVRKSRLVVIDDENCSRGVNSLSDILQYVLLHGEEED